MIHKEKKCYGWILSSGEFLKNTKSFSWTILIILSTLFLSFRTRVFCDIDFETTSGERMIMKHCKIFSSIHRIHVLTCSGRNFRFDSSSYRMNLYLVQWIVYIMNRRLILFCRLPVIYACKWKLVDKLICEREKKKFRQDSRTPTYDMTHEIMTSLAQLALILPCLLILRHRRKIYLQDTLRALYGSAKRGFSNLHLMCMC